MSVLNRGYTYFSFAVFLKANEEKALLKALLMI